MGTTGSGTTATGLGLEGPWYGTGCDDLLTIPAVSDGDLYIVWCNVEPEWTGATAEVRYAGGGAWRVLFTSDGTNVHNGGESLSMVAHHVLGGFDAFITFGCNWPPG